MPKVSVIVPNYNHAPYLEQRLNTVLEQTYQDFEIIFLDDASTDNSLEVFSKFSDNPRIKSIFNQTNSGSAFKQWNKGLEKAKGEYIWIAESDDYADPNFLETLVSILDNNPQVGLAYCQSYVTDREGNILKTNHWWTDDISQTRWKNDFINNGRDECKNYLAIKNTIPNASAVLFRKNVFNEVSTKAQSMKLCGDWMSWIKVLLKSDIAYRSKLLNYFRSHGNSVRGKSHQLTYLYEILKVMILLKENLNISFLSFVRLQSNWVEQAIALIFTKNPEFSLSKKLELYYLLKKIDNHLEIEIKMFKYLITIKVLQQSRIFAGAIKQRLLQN